jgi:hypothetical protein
MLLSSQQILLYGLKFLGMRSTRWSNTRKEVEFHKHYGSGPLVLADQWNDLRVDDHLPTYLLLNKKEKTEKGLKRFFVAHFFLWAYPKNASMLASRFKICDKYCKGQPLWKWVRRKKIVWDDNVANAKNMEILALTVDGTDFKMNEPKHKTVPIDSRACSHKMKHAAAKYKLAMAVNSPKCVQMAGPFKGGTHDLEMFRRGGLKEKLQALNVKIQNVQRIKLVVADRGYHSKYEAERKLFSTPNKMGSKELETFKSHARLRHETFNRRLKFFGSLSTQTFRHGFDCHKFVFEAVLVTVQYQMDNGSPIFAT